MRVGFDYCQVISHYPDQTRALADALIAQGHEVRVISAIGKGHIGTIAADVHQHWPTFPDSNIHEVVFESPKQAPELKLAKCQKLGITMFFDDRDDVCRLLNAAHLPAGARGSASQHLRGATQRAPNSVWSLTPESSSRSETTEARPAAAGISRSHTPAPSTTAGAGSDVQSGLRPASQPIFRGQLAGRPARSPVATVTGSEAC